jgi:hypothetical protein
LRNIYKKLGVGCRNEAIVRAADLHLLSEDSVARVTAVWALSACVQAPTAPFSEPIEPKGDLSPER